MRGQCTLRCPTVDAKGAKEVQIRSKVCEKQHVTVMLSIN
jgi:hypothetical protein